MPASAALSAVDRVSLPSHSMFVSTPVYALDDSTLVFGLRQPALVPAAGDSSVTVNSVTAHRLDLISHQLYGNPAGWWAIADVSNLLDPLAGVQAGTVLRVPATSRLPT